MAVSPWASSAHPASTPYFLSGVTDEATLLSPDNKIHPDYYMPQLSDLLTAKEALTKVVA